MANYWKTKVVPRFTRIFDKDGKKAAASEFSKTFSKEEFSKEIEEKKAELEPKVLEIYEASPAEIKALVKEHKAAKVKKYSASVTKFLDELVTIDFPGAKPVSEAAAKYGPGHVSGPVIFIFENVAVFIPKEEPKAAEAAPAEEAAAGEGEVEVVATETVEEKVEEIEKVEEATTSAEPATEEAAKA